jgi:hypothetical protein
MMMMMVVMVVVMLQGGDEISRAIAARISTGVSGTLVEMYLGFAECRNRLARNPASSFPPHHVGCHHVLQRFLTSAVGRVPLNIKGHPAIEVV